MSVLVSQLSTGMTMRSMPAATRPAMPVPGCPVADHLAEPFPQAASDDRGSEVVDHGRRSSVTLPVKITRWMPRIFAAAAMAVAA